MMDLENLQIWHSVLKLKIDDPRLGLKGARFLVVGQPQIIDHLYKDKDKLKMATEIAAPIWNGMQLGISPVFDYTITDEMLHQLFELDSITYEELKKQLEKQYEEKQKEESN